MDQKFRTNKNYVKQTQNESNKSPKRYSQSILSTHKISIQLKYVKVTKLIW
jgi:hypothetical protein